MFPFGWGELLGIANRGNYDLSQHMKYSNESLEYLLDDGTKIIPHVIEPSIGLDRLLLALLVDSYEEQELENNDVRIVLKLDFNIAPYQVAIFPLMKNLTLRLKKYLIIYCKNWIKINLWWKWFDRKTLPSSRCNWYTICGNNRFWHIRKNTMLSRERDSMKQHVVELDNLIKFLKIIKIKGAKWRR